MTIFFYIFIFKEKDIIVYHHQFSFQCGLNRYNRLFNRKVFLPRRYKILFWTKLQQGIFVLPECASFCYKYHQFLILPLHLPVNHCYRLTQRMRPLGKVGCYLFSDLEAICGAIAASSIDFSSGLEPSPLHRPPSTKFPKIIEEKQGTCP
jgi:hypothetical protein